MDVAQQPTRALQQTMNFMLLWPFSRTIRYLLHKGNKLIYRKRKLNYMRVYYPEKELLYDFWLIYCAGELAAVSPCRGYHDVHMHVCMQCLVFVHMGKKNKILNTRNTCTEKEEESEEKVFSDNFFFLMTRISTSYLARQRHASRRCYTQHFIVFLLHKIDFVIK